MNLITRRVFMTATLASTLVRPALAKEAGVSVDSTGTAIQGYDTRAYWSEGQARVGDALFSVEWQGVPWRFATQAEADTFAADPASFAPKFGGFCTRAMSFKKIVDGDPEVWRIFEGALYLFARPVGGTAFDKGQVAMIGKAQAYWDSLR